MSTLILSHDDVERLLPVEDCIDVMTDALSALARGELQHPLRTVVAPMGSTSLMGLMPAYRGGHEPLHSLKAAVVAPGNPARGLDAHQGTVTLFDGETGEVFAIMNASAITAIRTAAVSGVATHHLAREEARELAILGAGVQARAHLRALSAVREFSSVRVYSPTRAHAEALGATVADSAEECVRGADVIVTVTNSTEPVLRLEWLKDGAHLNVVGSSGRWARELDAETVAAVSLFVDRRESTLAECGEYADALNEGTITGPEHIRAELGEVLIGAHPGRTSESELTAFKSLGIAVEDLAAASYVLAKAGEAGVGTSVVL
jgi:ornithine cyclodeaminase/alanine dehydrogenase-like protein (mu-crystallin family)